MEEDCQSAQFINRWIMHPPPAPSKVNRLFIVMLKNMFLLKIPPTPLPERGKRLSSLWKGRPGGI